MEPLPKKKRGRPSSFNDSLRDYLVFLATEKAATDVQLAKAAGVTVTALNNWKRRHPDFLVALKEGKYIADELVEGSLFQCANGFYKSEEKAQWDKESGAWVKTTIQKYYPPNTVAQIFWLKNRQPEQWREKVEKEDPDQITIPIAVYATVTNDTDKTPK